MWWIKVESAAGDLLGLGPINNGRTWSYSNPLDKVGDFTLVLPAADPNAQYITAGVTLIAERLVNGTVTERGRGIARQFKKTVDPSGQVFLTVKGPSILQEWNEVLVFRAFGSESLARAQEVHYLSDNFDGTYTVEPWAWASDGDTSNCPNGGQPILDYEFIYVYGDAPPSGVYWYLGNVNTGYTVTMKVQYFDGAYWQEYGTVIDGTLLSGRTLGATGAMTWTLTGNERPVLHNEQLKYWVRFIPNTGGIGDNIQVHELNVYQPEAEEDAVETLSTLISGWSVDYTGTASSVLRGAYVGATALEALRASAKTWEADTTNENPHFSLGASGRTVQWIVTTTGTTPTPTVTAVPASGVMGLLSADMVLISSLSVEEDYTDLVTDIYPVGAGSGTSAVTLQAAYDRQSEYALAVAPSGFSYVRTATNIPNAPYSYGLRNTTLYTALGKSIARYVPFNDVANPRGAGAQVGTSADLMHRSVSWLRQHAQLRTTYKLKLTHVETTLLPGQTIRVVFRGVASDGSTYVDVDEALYIINTTLQLDSTGHETWDVVVSDVFDEIRDDMSLIGQMATEMRNMQRANPTVSGESVAGWTGGVAQN